MIRLTVMMCVRYSLSLRRVEDLLFEGGIDIRHESAVLASVRSHCSPRLFASPVGRDPARKPLHNAVPESYKVLPIVAAAARRHRAVVTVLLDLGGDVDALDPEYSLTALMMAADNGDVVLLERLIAAGARLDRADCYGGFIALMFAAEQGHLGAARLLIEQGADLDSSSEEGLSALDYARKHGHDEIAAAISGAQVPR